MRHQPSPGKLVGRRSFPDPWRRAPCTRGRRSKHHDHAEEGPGTTCPRQLLRLYALSFSWCRKCAGSCQGDQSGPKCGSDSKSRAMPGCQSGLWLQVSGPRWRGWRRRPWKSSVFRNVLSGRDPGPAITACPRGTGPHLRPAGQAVPVACPPRRAVHQRSQHVAARCRSMKGSI